MFHNRLSDYSERTASYEHRIRANSTDDLPLILIRTLVQANEFILIKKYQLKTLIEEKSHEGDSFQATAEIRIYFRDFDVDDPSADAAPIDTNDTAAVKTGNDNNGNVDGTPATKAGVLSIPV